MQNVKKKIDSGNPKERIKNIELLLLFHEEYITMQQISEWLEVSLSTVKADIKQVELFCKDYGLTFIQQSTLWFEDCRD